MTEPSDKNEQLLVAAKEIVSELEDDNLEAAMSVLEGIVQIRELELFQEVGKLTRELHDTLNNFQIDSRLADLTQDEIPSAKERLGHVITLTEEAANRTLTVVEDTLPRTEELDRKAAELKAQWDRFRSRDMKVEEFRGLTTEIDEFLSWTSDNAGLIHKGLSDVMMAQDFQDLTGQIIRRVITMVQEVEESLVHLVRVTGQQIRSSAKDEKDEKAEKIKAEGPQVPGVETAAEVVGSQDEVDDLLSSLGF